MKICWYLFSIISFQLSRMETATGFFVFFYFILNDTNKIECEINSKVNLWEKKIDPSAVFHLSRLHFNENIVFQQSLFLIGITFLLCIFLENKDKMKPPRYWSSSCRLCCYFVSLIFCSGGRSLLKWCSLLLRSLYKTKTNNQNTNDVKTDSI